MPYKLSSWGQVYWEADEEDSINFGKLRQANVGRCEQTFHKLERWTLTDWATAMGGECGEALNFVKKLRRLEDPQGQAPGVIKPGEDDREELLSSLAEELADLVLYADLLAARAGIDLGTAVKNKFNQKSFEVGSKIFL